MSIKMMTIVWDRSSHQGGALTMLLAIADFANDAGEAFPAIPTLARKCRLSERHATRLVKEIEASGEMSVIVGGGRNNTNLYKIHPDKMSGGQDVGVTFEARNPDTGVLETLTPASPEPSREPLEPSHVRTPPDESYAAMVAWNEMAKRVGLPQVQHVSEARKRRLKNRLLEAGGLEGWNAALRKIEKSSFLLGKLGRGEGHKNWRCDFDFVLREDKFAKIREGGFDDKPAPQRPTNRTVV